MNWLSATPRRQLRRTETLCRGWRSRHRSLKPGHVISTLSHAFLSGLSCSFPDRKFCAPRLLLPSANLVRPDRKPINVVEDRMNNGIKTRAQVRRGCQDTDGRPSPIRQRTSLMAFSSASTLLPAARFSRKWRHRCQQYVARQVLQPRTPFPSLGNNPFCRQSPVKTRDART